MDTGMTGIAKFSEEEKKKQEAERKQEMKEELSRRSRMRCCGRRDMDWKVQRMMRKD